MCVIAPSLALAGAGANLIGGLTSAAGARQQGQATQEANDYQAQVALNNSIIASQNAEYSIAAGQQKVQTEGLKEAQTAGGIKTAQAASGIDVNTGSAKEVQASQRETGALDEATTLNNAELQAYGYRTQMTSDEAQAQLDIMSGSNAAAAGDTAAEGDILSSTWRVAIFGIGHGVQMGSG